jgi:TetR/AcrR family transcriptional regulator, transcriptional repressor for nem operon
LNELLVLKEILKMKVTKKKALENRARIVEVASTLFRERGYDGVGVADLMAAAGFTHGGFYKHFRSKADLMAEAAARGFSQSAATIEGADPAVFVQEYLSRKHRDQLGNGCTFAALSGDAARQSESIKQAFATGIENQLTILERGDGAVSEIAKREARAKRIDLLAHIVGALVLSRACPDDSPLADEILEICRTEVLNQSDRKGERPSHDQPAGLNPEPGRSAE